MSLVAALTLSLLCSVPSAEDAQGAAARAAADRRLQTSRPAPERVDPPDLPDLPDPPDVSGIAPLLRAILWTGLIVVGLLVLFSVFTGLRERRGTPTARAPPAAKPVASSPDLAAPLDEASHLAAQGRYAEAVHALLLRTLALLAETSRVPEAWTSREIVDRLELAAPARASLEALVDETELSLFGGRPVDEAAYRRCLETFRRFREVFGS